MSDLDRRKFLLKTVQATGGVLAYSVLTVKTSSFGKGLGEGGPTDMTETEKVVDENFWVGGY
jgi:hypothetical protein